MTRSNQPSDAARRFLEKDKYLITDQTMLDDILKSI